MKFSYILERLKPLVASHSLTHTPELNPDVQGVSAIEEAVSGTLSYIDGGKFASFVKNTPATALILPLDEALQAQAQERGIAWLATSQPRLVFAQAIALFYQPYRPSAGIHPTAVIDPTATIGQQVSIGAHAVIQAGSTIGDQVCIHPNVVLYPEVSIGDRTVLHANCVIHERSQIGADCMIHSGAVIGAEGFGFVPTQEGWYKMEQSGYVILEDGVEIGCNSTIDRPSVGETRVGRNTKIDNLVQIGHGCIIGANGAIAAQAGLAGGTIVGNRVILGGQVGIANQARIGDGVTAGAKAGIHSSVPAGQVVMGYPGVPYNLFLKISAIYSRLPEMYQTYRRLQRRFGDDLENKSP
jgi:UDP-3-O-[3-hydroxymyristoyl] glucosamine N-acyltransferase